MSQKLLVLANSEIVVFGLEIVVRHWPVYWVICFGSELAVVIVPAVSSAAHPSAE